MGTLIYPMPHLWCILSCLDYTLMTLSTSPKTLQLRHSFAVFLVNIEKSILWVLLSGFLGFTSHGPSPHWLSLSTFTIGLCFQSCGKLILQDMKWNSTCNPILVWYSRWLYCTFYRCWQLTRKLRQTQLTKVSLAASDGLQRPLTLISPPYTPSCFPTELSWQLVTWSLHSTHFITFTPPIITVSPSLQMTLHLCNCTSTILLSPMLKLTLTGYLEALQLQHHLGLQRRMLGFSDWQCGCRRHPSTSLQVPKYERWNCFQEQWPHCMAWRMSRTDLSQLVWGQDLGY